MPPSGIAYWFHNRYHLVWNSISNLIIFTDNRLMCNISPCFIYKINLSSHFFHEAGQVLKTSAPISPMVVSHAAWIVFIHWGSDCTGCVLFDSEVCCRCAILTSLWRPLFYLFIKKKIINATIDLKKINVSRRLKILQGTLDLRFLFTSKFKLRKTSILFKRDREISKKL